MSDRKTVWNVKELLTYNFPPIRWIIPDLVPSGLTVLFGAPKLGKSWLMLSFAAALSVGTFVLGKIKVRPIQCLYLALEDPPRRLQNRLQRIEALINYNLTFATESPTGASGVNELKEWMERNPETKLIIIDTWGRFTNVQDGNSYTETTAAAAALKKIADDYDVAIIAVHHSRKAETTDFLNAALGSVGLPAVADTVMLLRRGRGSREAVLSITGRDVEEKEYALHFDSDSMQWELLGEKNEVQTSEARQQIFDQISESERGLTPKDISAELEKNHSTVKNLLRKMEKDGAVISSQGIYQVCKPIDPIDRIDPKETNTNQESTETTGSTGYRGSVDDSDSNDSLELDIF